MMLINNSTNSTGGLLLQTILYLSNFSDNSPNNTLEDFYHLPMGADTDIHKPQCYGVYGCFPVSGFPWKTDTRLVSLYPESPLKINPRYPVFHKNARVIPHFLDLNEPYDTRNAGINPQGNIFFIAHGYLESGDRPWIQDMINSLLDADNKGTASVIIVDWGGGSSPPYHQAVANIRLVGAITAHIVHMIYEELKLPNLDKVHMMGHSLGAHTCGYTGYTLQKDFGLMLGRITGMDPAEPLFAGTDPIVRLDRNDAKFVDVIHTDALPFSSGGNSSSSQLMNAVVTTFTQPYNPFIGLGMREAIGHVDFYPNGGYNNPGCDASMKDYIQQEEGSFFWGLQKFLSCNHIRSHQFMAESLKAKCPFAGITCESYDQFKQGHCFQCNEDGHQCIDFGMNSINSYQNLVSAGKIEDTTRSVKVYLMTSDGVPFCRTHYKVTIEISTSEESLIHGGELGFMSLVVRSQEEIELDGVVVERKERKETELMRMSPQDAILYEPGVKYTAVMPGRDVGTPTSVTISWTYSSNPLNPLTWRILETPRVYVDNIIIETLEHKTKLRMCSMYSDPVTTSSSREFRKEYCSPNHYTV